VHSHRHFIETIGELSLLGDESPHEAAKLLQASDAKQAMFELIDMLCKEDNPANRLVH
jgi:hypothetical protein